LKKSLLISLFKGETGKGDGFFATLRMTMRVIKKAIIQKYQHKGKNNSKQER